MLGPKFEPAKFKPFCRLAATRIKLQHQKLVNGSDPARKAIADLLRAGDENTAQVQAEVLLRNDYLTEALGILENMLDELSVKAMAVCNAKTCPPDLLEIISTIIFSAPRVNIKEFTQIREQLSLKFGKQFAAECSSDLHGTVNSQVKAKITINPADSPETVFFYLKSIAEAFNIPYSHEIIGDSPAGPAMPTIPTAQSSPSSSLPPPLFTASGAPATASPFPSIPQQAPGPSPFPSVPQQAGPSAFPSVPQQAGPSAFPSVPQSRPAPSAFPSVPQQTGPSPSAFPSVPQSRPAPSAFPSVPQSRPAPSAFPSVPQSKPSPSAFPSVPQSKPAPSAFPSVPQSKPAPSAFPSAPQSKPAPSAFPSAPSGVPPQRTAVPRTETYDASQVDIAPDALDDLNLPPEEELPDFDDLSARMDAIKKRH